LILFSILLLPRLARAQPCESSIDGHVVEAGTHEPMPGATVRANAIIVATDDAGRFTLSSLCPGDI
jgi:hypothetical protein